MVRKKVKKWTDGDSGVFSDDTRFRLASVRAPEKHQYGGSKATRVAAGMTGRSKGLVNVTQKGTDPYGRVIVEMSNKDGSINERLRKKRIHKKGKIWIN